VAEVFEEVPEIFKVLKILEEILEGVPCAFEKVTKDAEVFQEVPLVLENNRRRRRRAGLQSDSFQRKRVSADKEKLGGTQSDLENKPSDSREIDRSPGQSQPSVAPPLKAAFQIATGWARKRYGPRLTQETVTTVQNSLNSSPSHLPIPSPYPKTPHPTQGDAGLRSGSAGRRVPSDHTQNQGGFEMKGTKRVTCTHPLTHSDPSRGPSPGLPLPGQPSPGLSSPQDHGSRSSCESYWEPEYLISADFLDDNPPGSPQPIT
ncbi:3-demethoxyubiquinol 3-hydroxylase, partial [Dissostichus eleginoides]